MPIYEYVCKKCSNKFELLRLSINGFKSVECPECGSHKVVKEFSTFAPAVSGAAGGCADSTCSMPQMPGCASGMCGRN